MAIYSQWNMIALEVSVLKYFGCTETFNKTIGCKIEKTVNPE